MKILQKNHDFDQKTKILAKKESKKNQKESKRIKKNQKESKRIKKIQKESKRIKDFCKRIKKNQTFFAINQRFLQVVIATLQKRIKKNQKESGQLRTRPARAVARRQGLRAQPAASPLRARRELRGDKAMRAHRRAVCSASRGAEHGCICRAAGAARKRKDNSVTL